MKICFTLCSNNYLAQASLLAESFLKNNRDYLFYIGLIDKISASVNYPAHSSIHILPFENVIDAKRLAYMAKVYKIVELNTSAKPFYFDFFFNEHPKCDVIYLDPDIYVYSDFKEIEVLLEVNDFIITPHCLTPISLDNESPQERAFMKYGIYNLGFIALRKSAQSVAYIDWLKERLASLCYSEVNLGIYVDQSWVGFLPVFYDGVHISKHPGMNAAFWNLHERLFNIKDDCWFINDQWPLLFFHFSSFDTDNWQKLSRYQTRFTVDSRPDVRLLFEHYAIEFKKAKLKYPSSVPCVYTNRTLMEKIAYYWNRYQIRKKLTL